MVNVINQLHANISSSIKNGEGSHVTYIIGNNGTGKSRILAELAQHYGLADQGHVDSVLCISNAVTDRFKFGSSVDVKVKYLGSRTVGNAVHLTLLARSIAKNLCEGIVSSKFELFDKIKAALGTEFYLALPGLRKKPKSGSMVLEDLIDKRRLNGVDLNDVFSEQARVWMTSLFGKNYPFSEMSVEQAGELLKFFSFTPNVTCEIRKNNSFVSYANLSSGEQNRIALAVKLLSHADDRMLVLIDEPELSLHVQWQAEFHRFLGRLLAGYKNYHVVVATHSPVIVSEAAKDMPGESRSIILLEESEVSDASDISCRVASADDIKSFDQTVLDYFKLATYNSPYIDMKIAEIMLEAANSNGLTQEVERNIDELDALRAVKKVTDETDAAILEAIDLIQRHFAHKTERAS
ncbi:TPA: AAA family ATPase [Pseudomonas putida]|nr:AAA family ATPase [Pseudomonas putida]HDS3807658.1 AAA family ATPase [Pseudomonas putida]